MRESIYVEISDTVIHIVRMGSGYPLFILHGGPGGDHHIFGTYLDDLANDYQLLFVDQRGQGLSHKVNKESLTTKQMAKDIVEIASVLGLESYAVMGHSFGAFVALQHVVDHPEKVSHTILLNGAPSKRMNDEFSQHVFNGLTVELKEQIVKAKEVRQSAYSRGPTELGMKELYESINLALPLYFPTSKQEIIDEFMEEVKDTIFNMDVMKIMSASNYGDYNVRDYMKGIQKPVCIVTCEYDLICNPALSQEMYEMIPDSEYYMLDGIGHNSYVEKTEEVLEIVKNFIGK